MNFINSEKVNIQLGLALHILYKHILLGKKTSTEDIEKNLSAVNNEKTGPRNIQIYQKETNHTESMIMKSLNNFHMMKKTREYYSKIKLVQNCNTHTSIHGTIYQNLNLNLFLFSIYFLTFFFLLLGFISLHFGSGNPWQQMEQHSHGTSGRAPRQSETKCCNFILQISFGILPTRSLSLT